MGKWRVWWTKGGESWGEKKIIKINDRHLEIVRLPGAQMFLPERISTKSFGSPKPRL